MLNREEIAKIAKIKGNDNYFVSCYLNVDPVLNTKGDYNIHIKNMLKDTLESLDKNVRKKVKPDMEKIESNIFLNKRNFKKGIALLSSTESGFWKEFHLAIGLKNEIVVDKTPYMKPLLDVLDRYQRYAVMLVDKEFARLFVMHLGEIEEYKEVFTENIPGKHKKGGWFSLEQKSFERHIDYHVDLHLKDVIQQLKALISAGDIGRLVVGGSEEALSKTKSLFTKQMSDKIIGTFNINMVANINEVMSKVQTVLEKYENEEKNLLVDEMVTKAMKKENAVLGLDNVLSALREGRVMRLLYIKDYKDSGYVCGECGFLTSQKTDKCPFCKEEMKKVDYIVDYAAQKAVELGATVEVVSENKELKEAGSIGAILRY